MEWIAQLSGQTVSFSPNEVFNLLTKKVASIKEKADFEVLIEMLMEFLQAHAVLGTMSPKQIAAMSFATGYHYRIFIEKYSPEINEIELPIEQSSESNGNAGS